MNYFINKEKPWELFQYVSLLTRTSVVGIKISSSSLEKDVISVENIKSITLDEYLELAKNSGATASELKESITFNIQKLQVELIGLER